MKSSVGVLDALTAGGVQLVEITFAADGRISDADTAKSIALAAEQFDGKLLVGAGTVLTEAQAALAKSAGAGFLLSPNTDPAVISKTRELGMVSIPGAFTPTEAQNAHAAVRTLSSCFRLRFSAAATSRLCVRRFHSFP